MGVGVHCDEEHQQGADTKAQEIGQQSHGGHLYAVQRGGQTGLKAMRVGRKP
jgi:hypothetical protein